jgi:penicillin G amidase
VTGHNRDIAWGVTNTSADTQDLFIEKLDPAGHPGQYLSPDGWKPLQVITETIMVKGDQPITQTIRFTGHGPLISDALTAISATIGTTIQEPLAFQWTASKPGHIMEALLGLQQAHNWQEFRAALSKWSVPGQNFVYADRQGNIGYQMTGDQPIRKKGDGTQPVPGWTGEYDWSGYVPFDDLPRSYNPPEHFIATANNKSFGPGYKYPIEGTWAPPWRISRILEMLKAKDKVSVDDFRVMLTDTHSLMARHIAPLIAALKPSDVRAQAAVKLLAGWDGDLTVDSVPATIYEVTVQKALSETFSDELGADLFAEYLGGNGSSVLQAFELLIDKPNDPFWDRTDTPARENRDAILELALNDALSELTSGLGDDMTTWQWGKVHTITPRHTFGSQPIISGIVNLSSLPLGGDGTTVSVSGFELLAPYDIRVHQSYRMIIDVGDWNKSLAIFATGESGQPYSKHWGDMFAAWDNGEFNPLLYDPKQIEAAKEGVLTLTP